MVCTPVKKWYTLTRYSFTGVSLVGSLLILRMRQALHYCYINGPQSR